MAAILRDVATPGEDYNYVNKEHRLMADVADSLYNNPFIKPESYKPEYREIYNKYGEAFWKNTVKEMGRIDDILTNSDNAAFDFNGTSVLGQYKNLTGKK